MNKNDNFAYILLRAEKSFKDIKAKVHELVATDDYHVGDLVRLAREMDAASMRWECLKGYDEFSDRNPESSVEDFVQHRMSVLQRQLLVDVGRSTTDDVADALDRKKMQVVSNVITDLQDVGFNARNYHDVKKN